MEAQPQTPARWPQVDLAFLLAVAASGGIFLGRVYEDGYCSHFGVPPELVEFRLSNLYGESYALAVVLPLLMMFASVIGRVKAAASTPAYRVHVPAVLYLLLGLLMLLSVPWAWSTWLAYLAGAIVSFLLVEWRRRALRAEGFDAKYSLLDDTAGRFLVAAVLLISTWQFALARGAERAKHQMWFLTTTVGTDRVVVIRNYGDRLLCGKLDGSGARLTREFLVVPAVRDDGTRLTYTPVGRLSKAD